MAQNASIDAFYAKYRFKPNTVSIMLPGWLVRFGLSVSGEQDDMKEFRPLMRGLNNLRVLVMEDGNQTNPNDVQNLVAQVQKHQFQNLISVKEDGTRVNIMLKTKKTKKGELIKNVLIMVSEEDEFVLVTFNGRWKKELLQKVLEEQNGDFMTSIVGVK